MGEPLYAKVPMPGRLSDKPATEGTNTKAKARMKLRVRI
jgi:hypothetical protein